MSYGKGVLILPHLTHIPTFLTGQRPRYRYLIHLLKLLHTLKLLQLILNRAQQREQVMLRILLLLTFGKGFIAQPLQILDLGLNIRVHIQRREDLLNLLEHLLGVNRDVYLLEDGLKSLVHVERLHNTNDVTI